MSAAIKRSELALAAWVALLLLAALFAPAVGEPPHAQAFADQRAWWGLPNALDVLSNVPFMIAGVLGLVDLRRGGAPATGAATRAAAGLAVRWSLVLLACALAKLLEVEDEAIFAATGQLCSGHTLKHVVAAFAAWPVLHALAGRQNAPEDLAAWAPVPRA